MWEGNLKISISSIEARREFLSFFHFTSSQKLNFQSFRNFEEENLNYFV
jgi:hypothetical protein